MSVAGTFDVAGRLAEGRPAVDDFARYAEACQALGTCGHGLTGEVEQAYSTEVGLDLHALDADHAALTAAVAAVREAQQLQEAQLGALSVAWTGAGADAAADFLRSHSAASAQAVAALATAAEQVGALRDDLWRLVDAKVAAAESVDARTDGVRGEWLAAAETVNTGVGDRATASELVDAQVAPFVEQDVRAEWVAAMEEATTAIARRFEAAAAALTSEAPPGFSPAGGWAQPAGAAPAPPAMTEPAAAAAPPAPTGAGAMPEMGSALSGFSGLGQQLGEMISGLVPSIGDALGEVPEPEDDFELDDDAEEDPEDDEDEEDETGDADEDEDEDPDTEEAEESVAEPVAVTEPPAEEAVAEPPAPTPTPAPAPAAPLAAPVAPAPEPATPCEIAADEVPQVGE